MDNEDLGWKVFGGYRINDYLAVETAYLDAGDISMTANAAREGPVTPFVGGQAPESFTAPGTTDGVTISTMSRIDGIIFNGVAGIPLSDRLNMFVKGGVFIWEVDVDVSLERSNAPIPGPGASTNNHSGKDFMFGVGARYHINKNLAIRAEWERLTGILDIDIGLFSAGIQYNF